MTRKVTSFQMTDADQHKFDALEAAGHGTRTDIIRAALDRMYRDEVAMWNENFIRTQAIRTVEHATSTGYGAFGHVQVGETDGIYRAWIGKNPPIHGLTKDEAIELIIENMTLKPE